MKRQMVWDPLVRAFHWALVAGFTANALLTDPEGELHERIGFAILGLVLLRLFWGFVGPRHARFSDFPPSLGASIGQFRAMIRWRRDAHLGHSPLGALMVYNLLATILTIVLTGWMMTTNRWFGIAWVEHAHEFLVHWAEFSVIAHVAAVLIESRRLRINLPKAMVTGYKDLPPDGSGSLHD